MSSRVPRRTPWREDVHHPLFKYLFIVPLAGWILGNVARQLARRL